MSPTPPAAASRPTNHPAPPEWHEKRVRDLPGPGQHQLPSTLEARKGTISRHFVPSSLDDAVRRARGLPGPGAHDLKHPPPTGGRISDAKVKTTHDLAVQRAKLTPAPGTYDRAGEDWYEEIQRPSGGNWRDMAPRRRERPEARSRRPCAAAAAFVATVAP